MADAESPRRCGRTSGSRLFPSSLALLATVLGTLLVESHAQPTLATSPKAINQRVLDAYGKLPLGFEANQGQTEDQIRFISHSRGYALFLAPTEAVLVLKGAEAWVSGPGSSADPGRTEQASPALLRLQLIGADPHTRVAGLEQLPGKANYFIGNDPTRWRRDIPTYAKVLYAGLYPGVDLLFYGNQRQLECDFVVAPGSDPARIAFGFDGVDKLELDVQGDLVVSIGAESIRFSRPVVYQEGDGFRQVIAGTYVLRNDNQVGLQIGRYDPSRPLIVDPVLSYSTYLGGNKLDSGNGVAVDASGNAYVAGDTTSTNFPTVSPRQPALSGFSAAFVAKLDSTGSALLYSTYLDGNRFDVALGIAVDASGNAYVTGFTGSENFPTVNARQPVYGGGKSDAFVAKLDSTGSTLLYATFLGGDDSFFAQYAEGGSSIAVDASGHAYVTGYTSATNFPTANAMQQVIRGPVDAFASKLNATGSAFAYSTYLGGSGVDQGAAIAVGPSGNAYVTGVTFSTDFPTANPFQATRGAGLGNAFVTKLNPAGSGLAYSTYLGGNTYDRGTAIAVDPSGNAYVTGVTHSTDFPTANPLQAGLAGPSDAFVTKLNAMGSALAYSTYLGGTTGHDEGLGLAVDSSGHAYVTGFTSSTDFPTANPLPGSLGPSSSFSNVPFAAKLNPTGSSLVYSTFLGGTGIFDSGNAITADASGNAYVTGITGSTNFPTANPLQAGLAGFGNAFIAKLAPKAVAQTAPLSVRLSGAALGVVTSSPAGITCGTTCTASFMSGGPVALTAVPAPGSTFAGWTGGGCRGTDSCVVTVAADTLVTATFSAAITVTGVRPNTLPQGATNQSLTITGTDFVPAATVSVSGTGVTVDAVSVVNTIQLSVTVGVASTATTDPRDVTVSGPTTGLGATGAGLLTIVTPQGYLSNLSGQISAFQTSGSIREAGIASSLVASLNDVSKAVGMNNTAAKKMLFALLNRVNGYSKGRQIAPVVEATLRTGLLTLLSALP